MLKVEQGAELSDVSLKLQSDFLKKLELVYCFIQRSISHDATGCQAVLLHGLFQTLPDKQWKWLNIQTSSETKSLRSHCKQAA